MGLYVSFSLSHTYEYLMHAEDPRAHRKIACMAIHLIELRVTQDSRMLACTLARTLYSRHGDDETEARSSSRKKRHKKHPSE